MRIEQRYEERYSRAINGAADYETAERALRRYLVVMDRIASGEVE
jgi:hypothetical protein